MGKYLNLKIWEHGIKNPAMRITVVAKKDDKGIVTAELPNIPVKKQKQQKEKAAKEGKAKAGKATAATTEDAPLQPATMAAAEKPQKTEAKV